MPYKYRKYGVATANGTHIVIPMVTAGEVNFAKSADWTPAAGDVKITKDDGTPANIGTLPVYVANQGWKFVLTAAELTCKKLEVTIEDLTATKVVEDQFFDVETHGHASAMFAVDLSDPVRMGLTALPNAAADAPGGLPVSDAGSLDIDTLLSRLTADVATEAKQDIIDSAVDAAAVLTAAIKVQTDKMAFTVANKIDANTHYVNDIEVTGDGETGTEWNPA